MQLFCETHIAPVHTLSFINNAYLYFMYYHQLGFIKQQIRVTLTQIKERL